ncbi:hypothetical protein ACVME8_004618 [Bradyrhizobium diazoefficiens]
MTWACLCTPYAYSNTVLQGHQFSLKRVCPKRSFRVSSKDILVLGSCTM